MSYRMHCHYNDSDAVCTILTYHRCIAQVLCSNGNYSGGSMFVAFYVSAGLLLVLLRLPPLRAMNKDEKFR